MPKATTLTKQINIITFFENLTVELYVLYVLKTYVKFHANRILYIIQSLIFFLCIILYFKNSKF